MLSGELAAVFDDARDFGNHVCSGVLPAAPLPHGGEGLARRPRDYEEVAAARGGEEGADGLGRDIGDVLELVEVRPVCASKGTKGGDRFGAEALELDAEACQSQEGSADAVAQTHYESSLQEQSEAFACRGRVIVQRGAERRWSDARECRSPVRWSSGGCWAEASPD